jgi:hypothetical protein
MAGRTVGVARRTAEVVATVVAEVSLTALPRFGCGSLNLVPHAEIAPPVPPLLMELKSARNLVILTYLLVIPRLHKKGP